MERQHPFNIARERELLFARACGGLAGELRKGGPDLFVMAFSMNAGLALEEVVESCIRRTFCADAIRFAGSGDFRWLKDSSPQPHAATLAPSITINSLDHQAAQAILNEVVTVYENNDRLKLALGNEPTAENINNFILAFNFEKFLVIFC
jgi:hypothetical protein